MNRRIPNGTYGGVRGRRFKKTASYSIFMLGLPGQNDGLAPLTGGNSVRKSECVQEQEQCLFELMNEAEILFRQAGERLTPYFARTEELADRLREERFHLAVLGQFKRGKSSLINALLGGEFLPTSSIPLTALPTVVRWGKTRRAVIAFQNGQTKEGEFADDQLLTAFLTRFVTEQENPHNCQGVKEVQVEYPADFLIGGVTLIDTPGIGSTFKHNTETTLQFLNQCDAALFIVSADPPITASEVEFLQAVKEHIHKLFFVLNKVDYLNAAERETVIAFLRKVLHEQAGVTKAVAVYGLSARQALAAKQSGDAQLFEQSGLGVLEAELTAFFQKEKKAVLTSAIKTKFAAVLQETSLDLGLTLRALELPVADLAAKQELLAQKLAEIEEQRRVAGDLLAGDKRRTLDFLESQADALRQKAQAHLGNIVAEMLGGGDRSGLERAVHEVLAQAVPVFFDRELTETADRFGDYIAGILAPHRQRADALVAAVRQAAADVFAIEYQAAEQEAVFQMKRQPYWVKEKWQTGLGVIPHAWLEALLPGAIRQDRVRKRLEQYVDALVTQNVENLRWALLQNMETVFRTFAETLKMRLAEAVHSTNQAVAAAAAMKSGQAGVVEAELARLRSVAQDVQQLALQLKMLETGQTGGRDCNLIGEENENMPIGIAAVGQVLQ